MTGSRTPAGLARTAAAVLVVAAALTACSPQPGAEIPSPMPPSTPSEPSATPTPAAPATPTTPPTPVPPPATPGTVELPEDLPVPTGSGTLLTVTGTVTEGVEQGCLVLTHNGTTYLLLGARDQLHPGTAVSVDGTLAKDVVTTCQQGTPLLVRAVRPL